MLLPGCSEFKAADVAERMRADVEQFTVDDGRGAAIEVSLSIGVTTWEPQQYPAIDMPALAEQMQSVASKGLQTAKSAGGNQVSVARLSVPLL